MNITGMDSSNTFDMTSFLEKTRSNNNMIYIGNNQSDQQNAPSDITNGISAKGFLDKAKGNYETGQSMYHDQTNRLNAILGMAMQGQDVSGLLEGSMATATLDAAEPTLDAINEDIETKAQEAMNESSTVEEQVPVSSENQIAIDAENASADTEGQEGTNAEGQMVTDAEGQVVAIPEGQVVAIPESPDTTNAEAAASSTTNASNTTETKSTKESVDLYV